MGSPSCMGTFVDRRGVTSCERSLVGVSDLIQGSRVFTYDCCKGASWIPGKSCKFYTRDIRYHWFSRWWGASQGHKFNTQLKAHIPVQGLCLSHPACRNRDQEHPLPKTALFDLWTALTLQNQFFWENNKTPVYYLLTAFGLFPQDPKEEMGSLFLMKYEAEFRAAESAVMCDFGSLSSSCLTV